MPFHRGSGDVEGAPTRSWRHWWERLYSSAPVAPAAADPFVRLPAREYVSVNSRQIGVQNRLLSRSAGPTRASRGEDSLSERVTLVDLRKN